MQESGRAGQRAHVPAAFRAHHGGTAGGQWVTGHEAGVGPSGG